MTKTIVFVERDGTDQLIETELPDNVTYDAFYATLAKLGIEFDEHALVFIGEEDEPLKRKGKGPVPGLVRGARLHVSLCRKVKVTVHFVDDTIEDSFSPGTRVKRVKAWAVGKFGLEGQDAAEHVLQLCGSKDRPASDTPLQRLTDGKLCAVCFDLVPEKRVEG